MSDGRIPTRGPGDGCDYWPGTLTAAQGQGRLMGAACLPGMVCAIGSSGTGRFPTDKADPFTHVPERPTALRRTTVCEIHGHDKAPGKFKSGKYNRLWPKLQHSRPQQSPHVRFRMASGREADGGEGGFPRGQRPIETSHPVASASHPSTRRSVIIYLIDNK